MFESLLQIFLYRQFWLAMLLVFIAAKCNAVMDVVSHKWTISIFRKIENKFLFKFFHKDSWKNKYVDYDNGDKSRMKLIGNINFPVQLTDAWHLCKSIVITCLIMLYVIWPYLDPVSLLGAFALLGLNWNITFLLFYKRVFIEKKYRK